MLPLNYTLQFSQKARRDVKDILRYTAKTWGTHQRLRYKAVIDDALSDLIKDPQIGRYRRDIGIYTLSIGSHIAIYSIADDDIIILRVLHQKMNWEMQFYQ